MAHFYIRNAGSLNRRLLELIGLSTKRDRVKDNTVIGYKGSGSKLAAVAAIRLGIVTGIASNDENGAYFLEFDTEKICVDGLVAHHVHYRYYLCAHGAPAVVTQTRFPSSMTLEAFPDWDKPIGDDKMKAFKMLREHVCNAYDADKYFSWGTCDSRAFAIPGETVVYLDYTDEFRAVFESPERYFKFLSAHQPYAVIDGVGEIWPKSENAVTRLFLLGVLADCDKSPQRSSVFDYSLYDKDLLSEERTLKYASAYTSGVGRIFAALSDVKMCRTVLQGIITGKGKLEDEALGTLYSATSISDEAKKAWLKAAHALLGEKIALPSHDDAINSDAWQMYGHAIVRVGDDNFRRFLKLIGVPSADDVFPRNTEHRVSVVRFEDLKEESRRQFAVAFAIFARHFPDRARYPVYFFDPLDEPMRRFTGFAGMGSQVFKEIWIQTIAKTSLPNLQSLIITLVHESRHCATRKHDHDRGFVVAAEHDILQEILRQVAGSVIEDGKNVPDEYAGTDVKPVFGASSNGRPVRGVPSAQSSDDAIEVTWEELQNEAADETLKAVDELLKDLNGKT